MLTVPAETPVTTPVAETVAIEVDELLQVPPPVASLSVIVAPAQTVESPEITPTAGVKLTVIAKVAMAVPQEPVTV